jgi:Holliday junction DNA helicase RuvB
VPTEEENKLLREYLKFPTIFPKKHVADSSYTPDIFTPQNFGEYIGQDTAKDLATIMVTAANNERRPLPNIMIVGEYGLGKTSLARIIMREAKVPHRMYDGASINSVVPDKGTFIIDEIHNLDSSVADSFNLHLDNGDFHVIGCTNNPGMLPSAFRSRFRTIQLYPYEVKDLKIILQKVCERKNIKYSGDSLELLALRSRFNARQAIMYLSMVFDIMSVSNIHTVNMEVVNETFVKMGVDSRGLLPRDRKYLEILPNRPVGLQYLSAVLGVDDKTIEEEIEPFLMRMGFIDRTPRGRVKIEG